MGDGSHNFVHHNWGTIATHLLLCAEEQNKKWFQKKHAKEWS
jgi:hypothetical protein